MSDTPTILLTAFRGTSSERLISGKHDCPAVILPNDKIKDSEILISYISGNNVNYIISFGQKPNIRDKIHIETTAQSGEVCIDTDFDCAKLQSLFEKAGIPAKISHNAGTSYCNRLYLNTLTYLRQSKADVKMVFLHIPFIKNITDFSAFREGIFSGIAGIDNSY